MPTENHDIGVDGLASSDQAGDAAAAGQVVREAVESSTVSNIVRGANDRASGQQ